jgi:dienelactone hydrolase
MFTVVRLVCRSSLLSGIALAEAFLFQTGWPLTSTRTTAAEAAKEMLIRIPREGTPDGMLTRLCLSARTPAPLVVINHGSPATADSRQFRKPSQCGEAAHFFTMRGYTVAFPLRRGYGETGGRWAETYGKCDSANYVGAGEATADDIAAAVDYLLRQPYIAQNGTMIIGQSAGGWGTLAFASRNPRSITAFINFAGGRGAAGQDKDNGINCSPDALIASAGVFGKTTRQPTLWIYAENDSLINKELSGRMHVAYVAAGGQGRYELLPPFGSEGHNLFQGKGGSKIWGPIVDRWVATSTHDRPH